MHGYATGAYPRTDLRRLAQTGRLRFWAKENAPVCFRKESESTVSNEKPKGGSAPRNWLVPVILVSIREWNSYGYELMERASAFGFEAMNPGTLYRTLRQMKKADVVESSWETSRGGPARRMYAITDAGEAHLDFWVKSLEQYRHTMNDFFRLYAGRPSHTDENAYDYPEPRPMSHSGNAATVKSGRPPATQRSEKSALRPPRGSKAAWLQGVKDYVRDESQERS